MKGSEGGAARLCGKEPPCPWTSSLTYPPAAPLCHSQVYCWIFSSDNKLLLQKRSERKKIGRSQWDLSLAEHLQPGESFREAVVRGLREELGIPIDRIVEDQERLVEENAVHRRELHGVNSVGDEFHDIELVQSFFCQSKVDARTMAEMVTFDDGEVSDVRFVDPDALQGMIEEDPAGHTEWLKAESAMVGLSRPGRRDAPQLDD